MYQWDSVSFIIHQHSRSVSVLKQCLHTLKHTVHTYIMPLVVVKIQHIYISDKTPHILLYTQKQLKQKSTQ